MSERKSNRELTYVGIYDAKGLRKNLLTNAKELLLLLKDIQLEKIKNKVCLEKVSMVKNNIKEIETLSNRMINLLPTKSLSSVKIKTQLGTHTKVKEEKGMKDNELDRIDLEIKRIEQLLNKI